jgi:hypothetical protein
MSRDRDVRALLDHPSQPASAGREMPRGGRSGGTARPRGRVPENGRDALTRQLTLPRGPEREAVRIGSKTVALRGSDVRTLALVGAFRVADARDLEPQGTRDRWHGDLEHLRREGLVALTPHLLDGQRTALVTLTHAGRSVLEQYRQPAPGERPQVFYAGLVKPRELTHDAQATGETSGRPNRSTEEIRAWADANGLPVVQERVQFPDVRIEYEHADGRLDREDHELATGHYNSRQMAAKQASGFQMHRSSAGQLRGARAGRGGSPFDPHAAERLIR